MAAVSFEEFSKNLYMAYCAAEGDLYKFWELLNPGAGKIARTTKKKKIFLYCNKNPNKEGGYYYIRKAYIDQQLYEFSFRTATEPKYHGYIVLEDYTLDEVAKKVIVYKYGFLTSRNVEEKNDEQLPF